MSRIIEAGDLPEQEKVYLKKGMFGYRIVHPIKNESGKTNWVNLLVGGWANFFFLLFVVVTMLLFFAGVKEITASCKDMAENPCNYFAGMKCPDKVLSTPNSLKIIPNFTFNGGDNNETG